MRELRWLWTWGLIAGYVGKSIDGCPRDADRSVQRKFSVIYVPTKLSLFQGIVENSISSGFTAKEW